MAAREQATASSHCGTPGAARMATARRWSLATLVTAMALLTACGDRVGPFTPSAAAVPPGPLREVAFVANGVGGTITLIDVDTLKVIGSLNVVPDGTKVGVARDGIQSWIGQPFMERSGKNYAQDQEVSPDGRVLYVSRGHLGDVAAFDLATGRLLWRVPVGGFRADHMTLSADGSRLYVSALTANKVTVVDTGRAEVAGSFATGNWPHDNRISRDGKRVFNASIGTIATSRAWRSDRSALTEWAFGPSYALTVADTATLKVLKRYAFPGGIRPWKLSLNEDKLYAQLSDYHGVVEYDLATARIVRRLDLPTKAGVTSADWDFEAPHHGLDMTSDGKTLCIAGRASDYVALISTETLKPLAFVNVGDAPGWAAITSDSRYCLVPNTRSDDVSVVSIAEHKEVARLRAGRGPKHIRMGRVPAGTLAAFTAWQPAGAPLGK